MHSSRISTVLVLAAVVLVASAHVTVSPREAAAMKGGDFIVRVPTEKPVPTVELKLDFPRGLKVSRLRAKSGWTAQVERDTSKAITSVTWSGGRIGPDEYDEFGFSARISAQPGDTLAVKAYQKYEGGEVVEWTETVDPKAKHPAPRIAIKGTPSKFAAAAQGNWLGGTALV